MRKFNIAEHNLVLACMPKQKTCDLAQNQRMLKKQ